MTICRPMSTFIANIICLSGGPQRQMNHHISDIYLWSPSRSCLFFAKRRTQLRYATMYTSKSHSYSTIPWFHAIQGSCFGSNIFKQKNNFTSLTLRMSNRGCSQGTVLKISPGSECIRQFVPRKGKNTKIKFKAGPSFWRQKFSSAGLLIALLVCSSISEAESAEASDADHDKQKGPCYSHGKKVYTDYSVIGIPGDGRCLFRSVAHGACLRSGKPAPTETLQRELADELRARVADEFIKRRKDTEWFIEGDFDTYVSKIRNPHVWGGEPELLMASHVLQMPITVYMHDQDSGGLISIAEYGQEYGKDNPINVLYHGFGHYNALQFPGKKSGRSRL